MLDTGCQMLDKSSAVFIQNPVSGIQYLPFVDKPDKHALNFEQGIFP